MTFFAAFDHSGVQQKKKRHQLCQVTPAPKQVRVPQPEVT